MQIFTFPLYPYHFHSYHHTHLPSDVSGGEYAFWYFLPFAVAIFYLIYKFFRNRNRVSSWYNGRIPNDFEPTEKNIAEVYIVLAAATTKRGKAFIQSKERYVSAYMDEHFPKVICMVDESFDYAIWNTIDVPELVFWCNRHLNTEQKLQLFEFLVEIAAMDHEIVPAELEILLYILNKFAIPYDSLSDDARKAIEVERPQESKPSGSSMKQQMLSVLGLKDNASILEIKRTYRVLVKKLHPDRHPNASEEERTILVARFQELQEAYDYLLK